MLPLHPAMRSPSPAYNLRPLTSGAREDGSKKLNIVSISRLTNESLSSAKGGNHLGGGGLQQRWSAAVAGDDLGSGGAVAAGDDLGSGGGQQRLVTASTPAGAAVAGTREEERVVDGGIISRGRSKHAVEGVQAEIAVEGVESVSGSRWEGDYAMQWYRGRLEQDQQLLVHLPNRSTAEGQLLFFNAHYRIALLEALVDFPLEPANFGSSPKFGQKVFTLARDKKSSFFARSGTVLLQDPPFFLKYKYWLSLSSAIELCGTGGPAIDERGDVAGMTFGRLPNPDVLSISILQTCIDMWRRFSRVARPFLDMDLIAFETLDITHQEEIESEHGITDGFIVDLVCDDSTAGRLGISRGDVIVSYNGLRDFTLHTFEEYLLNLGWGFLESTDPSWTINLELEIYDPVRGTIRGVTFPLGFSDICEDVLVLP
ncbi:hypothetical protein OsJ_17212 [Oryza sativa Japonica Group]|uniref:PDZ domain-containing protein n=1 Tax=Oryza sativa subsp. japonica TaxID=39947 RepID=B9FML3_ORYSJ|nr:hypothetical protein OsJ_17212 [Oryza sativa Japonica Group]